MFDNRCRICSADAADLDEYTRLGQTLHGGNYHVTGGTLLKAAPGGGILFFSVTQDPSILTDRAGKTVKAFESSKVPRAYLEFQLTNNKWIAIGSVVG